MRGIVLFVIDCLRADHLSCYGYHRATTPTIDALAQRGVLWENAYATSSWTKPSVTSMFTGLYPSQHGVFRGIKRREGRSEATTDVLASTHTTLAERLGEHGWRSGAFINNAQLGEFAGLNRGYDAYVPNAGKADRLLELFSTWLDTDPKRPFFAYLHFLEAHWPYKPRRRHVAEFGGNRDTNRYKDFSAREFGQLRRAIRHDGERVSEDHLAQMIQMYDGAVRRLDGKLKILLASLRDRGLEDDTAVFVTADHGEEFLDHGQIGHGQSLYEELIHVPLIGFAPSHAGGIRHSQPISQVDLSRLLLNTAGVGESGPGDTRLYSTQTGSAIYAELSTGRTYRQVIRADGWKLHRRFGLTRAPDQPGQSRSPREQFLHRPDDVELELYDLSHDPGEKTDLADDPRHLAHRSNLVARLDSWWRDISSAETCEVEMDPRVVQRLHDLGYLE